MAKDSTETTARTRRTPEQIAQAELDKATARVEKARQKVTDAEAAVEPARAELKRAEHLHAFASQHPDLPQSDPVDALSVEG